jgi:GDP/UDP-N,N'-diacetylbacillosamine 2-epimerase (hydrolysing)
MGGSTLNIAVLTSSRADYGIYLPLMKRLQADTDVELHIIAFGTHCDKRYGNTVDAIENDGFSVAHQLTTLSATDTPYGIALSYGNTVHKFAKIWETEKHFDWVLALGDRFEMAAAVNAGIPFGIRFAHLHAGETTSGAIDEIYRHQISLASKMHLVSAYAYAKRVHQLVGNTESTHLVGALSLEKLEHFSPFSKEEFLTNWKIDFTVPAVLMTVHPETVNYKEIQAHINALQETIPVILTSHQLIVTLPNADTYGSYLRTFFAQQKAAFPEKITLIENFGNQAYFTCMTYADLLIGNTSSGIIEAASFGKYVIDLGDRQKGRIASANVVNVPFQSNEIVKAFHELKGKTFSGENVYFQPLPSVKILKALKSSTI